MSVDGKHIPLDAVHQPRQQSPAQTDGCAGARAFSLGAIVAATVTIKERLHRYTKFGVPMVMLFSMSLNALEFSQGATNYWELAAGIGMGMIFPGLTYLAFRVAAVLADV